MTSAKAYTESGVTSGVAARQALITWVCCLNAANNEIAHVEFLRTALGNEAVSMPVVDIGPLHFHLSASSLTCILAQHP